MRAGLQELPKKFDKQAEGAPRSIIAMTHN
jgi:hypothetical protein